MPQSVLFRNVHTPNILLSKLIKNTYTSQTEVARGEQVVAEKEEVYAEFAGIYICLASCAFHHQFLASSSNLHVHQNCFGLLHA